MQLHTYISNTSVHRNKIHLHSAIFLLRVHSTPEQKAAFFEEVISILVGLYLRLHYNADVFDTSGCYVIHRIFPNYRIMSKCLESRISANTYILSSLYTMLIFSVVDRRNVPASSSEYLLTFHLLPNSDELLSRFAAFGDSIPRPI